MSFAEAIAIAVLGSAVFGTVFHVRLTALRREAGDLERDSLPSTSNLLQLEAIVLVAVVAVVCVQVARGADADIVGPVGSLAFATSVAAVLTWRYAAFARLFYGSSDATSPSGSPRSRVLSVALAVAIVLVLLAIR